MASRKLPLVISNAIRRLSFNAARYRLKGNINKAVFYEDQVDVLVKRAERMGCGDEAFSIETDAKQAADRKHDDEKYGRDPRKKRAGARKTKKRSSAKRRTSAKKGKHLPDLARRLLAAKRRFFKKHGMVLPRKTPYKFGVKDKKSYQRILKLWAKLSLHRQLAYGRKRKKADSWYPPPPPPSIMPESRRLHGEVGSARRYDDEPVVTPPPGKEYGFHLTPEKPKRTRSRRKAKEEFEGPPDLREKGSSGDPARRRRRARRVRRGRRLTRKPSLRGARKTRGTRSSRDPASYVTTYCNFPHRMSDGKPIGHECYVLPPAALKAEREGDIEKAIQILQRHKPLRIHRGIKR